MCGRRRLVLGLASTLCFCVVAMSERIANAEESGIYHVKYGLSIDRLLKIMGYADRRIAPRFERITPEWAASRYLYIGQATVQRTTRFQSTKQPGLLTVPIQMESFFQLRDDLKIGWTEGTISIPASVATTLPSVFQYFESGDSAGLLNESGVALVSAAILQYTVELADTSQGSARRQAEAYKSIESAILAVFSPGLLLETEPSKITFEGSQVRPYGDQPTVKDDDAGAVFSLLKAFVEMLLSPGYEVPAGGAPFSNLASVGEMPDTPVLFSPLLNPMSMMNSDVIDRLTRGAALVDILDDIITGELQLFDADSVMFVTPIEFDVAFPYDASARDAQLTESGSATPQSNANQSLPQLMTVGLNYQMPGRRQVDLSFASDLTDISAFTGRVFDWYLGIEEDYLSSIINSYNEPLSVDVIGDVHYHVDYMHCSPKGTIKVRAHITEPTETSMDFDIRLRVDEDGNLKANVGEITGRIKTDILVGCGAFAFLNPDWLAVYVLCPLLKGILDKVPGRIAKNLNDNFAEMTDRMKDSFKIPEGDEKGKDRPEIEPVFTDVVTTEGRLHFYGDMRCSKGCTDILAPKDFKVEPLSSVEFRDALWMPVEPKIIDPKGYDLVTELQSYHVPYIWNRYCVASGELTSGARCPSNLEALESCGPWHELGVTSYWDRIRVAARAEPRRIGSRASHSWQLDASSSENFNGSTRVTEKSAGSRFEKEMQRPEWIEVSNGGDVVPWNLRLSYRVVDRVPLPLFPSSDPNSGFDMEDGETIRSKAYFMSNLIKDVVSENPECVSRLVEKAEFNNKANFNIPDDIRKGQWKIGPLGKPVAPDVFSSGWNEIDELLRLGGGEH